MAGPLCKFIPKFHIPVAEQVIQIQILYLLTPAILGARKPFLIYANSNDSVVFSHVKRQTFGAS